MLSNLICKYKKCRLKLFQTALLLINLYNLLLISSTAFTKASESEGSKEEWPAWTILNSASGKACESSHALCIGVHRS